VTILQNQNFFLGEKFNQREMFPFYEAAHALLEGARAGTCPERVSEIYASILDPPGSNLLKNALLAAARRLHKSCRTNGWEDVHTRIHITPAPRTAAEAIAAARSEKLETPTLVIRFSTRQEMAAAALMIASAWHDTLSELPEEGSVDTDTVVSKLAPRIRATWFGNMPPKFCMSNAQRPGRHGAVVVTETDGANDIHSYGQGFEGCNVCRASAKKVFICSRCMDVGYCSAECQRAGWNEHRSHCNAFERLTDQIATIMDTAGLTCRKQR